MMIGKAKQQFYGQVQTAHPFDPVDLALGEGSLAVAYLSLAARCGHLCVQVDGNTLSPAFREMAIEVDDDQLEKRIVSSFEQLEKEPHPYVVQAGSTWYLARFHRIEQGILREIERLSTAPLNDTFDIETAVHALVGKGALLEKQGEAVLTAARHPLTLLTGGPGTGKTYTIRQMISLVQEAADGGLNVLLAAPTGKAAANLTKGLGGFQATTLHKLLNIRPGQQQAPTPLDADLVIIDECSMIDAQLFLTLLRSVKTGARLVLVGDPCQLPSVEAGGIFADMVEMGLPHQHLSQCQRAELESLISLAQAVNDGEPQEALQRLSQPGIERLDLPANNTRQLQKAVVELLGHPRFPLDTDPKALLEHFQSKILLTPMRQGALGVEALNQLAVERYGSQAAPILITQNDPKNGLNNGDMGVLIKQGEHLQRGDKAYFPDPSAPDGVRTLPALLLPKHEFAYALSVHKSQGSEYPHVLLLLPKGAESFGRQVLYTAITRVRKHLAIWCADEVFIKTIENNPRRLSRLNK